MRELPRSFKILFSIVSSIALILTFWFIFRHPWRLENIVDLFFFAVLAVVSESLPVALPKEGYVTVGYAIFIASIILFPIGIGIPIVIIGGGFVFGKGAEGQLLYKRIFNASQYVLSITIAYLVLEFFNIQQFQFNIKNFLIYLFVALCYSFTNMTFVSIALGTLFNKSPWSIWAGNIRWSIPNFLALAPLGILMAMIYSNYGAIGLILLFVPLLIARHSFQLYMDMRKNYLNTVEALVQALEAKDSYTSGHSSRVAQWSVKIAEELGLPEDRLEFIKYAGVLHDVGKIGVSENILNKKGQLEDSEWEMIRNHPVIGQNIIQGIDFLFDVGAAVRYHHERYDGTGYPEGIVGEAIPLESRIIAVADTYDAMTSDRSYRNGLSSGEALVELKRVAGTQLDLKIVQAFCSIVQEENPQLLSSGEAQIVI